MPIYISNKKLYTTKEAAVLIGRSRDTLLRWVRMKLLSDVQKDRKGNRIWTDEDINVIRKVRDEMERKKMMRGVR
jgi:DNA-binding transcriptional MerR regulator